jgi:hypothetical protein
VKVRIVASGIAIAALAGVVVPTALSASASATTPTPTTPTITKCAPATALVGHGVTIHGTGLTGATKVTIGGRAAKLPSTPIKKSIRVKVPTGVVNGMQKVKVVTPSGTASHSCKFKKPAKK